jgi:hypothetical protein
MFLFLIGVGLDIPTIILISFVLFILGLFISRLSKTILRKTLKRASDRKIKILSRIGTFFLAPVFLIGIFALLVFVSTPEMPTLSEEELISDHYKMMEEEFAEDLKIGMSKIEIMEKFGKIDTTGSVLVIDLSLPEAEERYLLQLNFAGKHLTSYRRQP